MRQPRKPDPEVMESDYRIPTALGTAAWVVALIVLLAMGDRLPAEDRWWRWVCVTGIAFGIFAFAYIPRHLRSRAEGGRRAAAEPGGAVANEEDRSSRPDAREPGEPGESAAAAAAEPTAPQDGAAPPDTAADPPASGQSRHGGDTAT